MQNYNQFEDEPIGFKRQDDIRSRTLSPRKLYSQTPNDFTQPRTTLRKTIENNRLDSDASSNPVQEKETELANIDKKLSKWKTNPLKIIHKVNAFIVKLKHASPSIRFKLLRQKSFDQISDNTAEYTYYLNNYLFDRKPSIIEKLEYILHYGKTLGLRFCYFAYLFFVSSQMTIKPGSLFLIIWDIIMAILTIINIIYVPIEVAYSTQKDTFLWTQLLLNTLPSYIFVIDILLTFFKAFYKRGMLISDRKEIFWDYVQGTLIQDLLVVGPFILQQFGFFKRTNYLMLLRVTRVKKMLDNFEDLANFQEKSAAFFELFSMIYYVLLCAHFCACSWSLLGHIEKTTFNMDNTWLDVYFLVDEPWTKQYIFSIYWTAITTMTVGYGDIVPQTDPERVFVTVVVFVFSIVFGYVVSSIGNIINRLTLKREIYKNKLRIINHHIKKRGINSQLSFKVRRYFEYYLKFKLDEEFDLDTMMKHMNQTLKSDVLFDMYHKILQKSSILTATFSRDFLRTLSQNVKEKTFAPEEIIFNKGTLVNELSFVLQGNLLTFAEKGSIKNKFSKEETQLRQYGEGSVMGEYQFFLNKEMEFSVKAMDFLQIAYLTRDDFFKILNKFPEDHLKYCQLRDQLTFGEVISNGGLCENCLSTHKFQSCPFVFFNANKEKCIYEAQRTEQQIRKKTVRFLKKKWKTQQNQRDLLQWMIDNVKDLLIDPTLYKQFGIRTDNIDFLQKLQYCSAGIPESEESSQQSQAFQPPQTPISRGNDMEPDQISIQSPLSKQPHQQNLPRKPAQTQMGQRRQSWNELDMNNMLESPKITEQIEICNTNMNIDKIFTGPIVNIYQPTDNADNLIRLFNKKQMVEKFMQRIKGQSKYSRSYATKLIKETFLSNFKKEQKTLQP